MLKEITRNDVLNVLRRHETRFSKYPNSNNVITLERQEWNEDAGCPEDFDVEVRFSHPNYIYILLQLYGADKNIIRDGGFGVDVFSLVPRIKTIVKQLQNDGYLNIYSQKCSFYTEREVKPQSPEEYDQIEMENEEYQMRTGESYKRYINAEARFTKDELQALSTALFLETKGQSTLLHFKERFFSEPIGLFSLLISIVSILVSLLST